MSFPHFDVLSPLSDAFPLTFMSVSSKVSSRMYEASAFAASAATVVKKPQLCPSSALCGTAGETRWRTGCDPSDEWRRSLMSSGQQRSMGNDENGANRVNE